MLKRAWHLQQAWAVSVIKSTPVGEDSTELISELIDWYQTWITPHRTEMSASVAVSHVYFSGSWNYLFLWHKHFSLKMATIATFFISQYTLSCVQGPQLQNVASVRGVYIEWCWIHTGQQIACFCTAGKVHFALLKKHIMHHSNGSFAKLGKA